MRLRALGLSLVAFVALAGACTPIPPPNPKPPPPGTPTLTVTDYATGLSRPWDIKFLPDGKGIFTENNSGNIYVQNGPGGTRTTVGNIDTLDTTAAFSGNGEGGLMGLALHPDFANNPYVYVCYSTTADNRVARLTLDYPTSTTLSGWQALVTGIPYNSSFHNGCRIDFQPGSESSADGPALFVTTGDAGQATGPQDVNGLGGKVLRIKPDGTAYPGNGSGAKWFTRGHRNPQGIAFRPDGTNAPFSLEHGPDKNDEANKLVNGGNAGWKPDNGGVYDQSKPMTDGTLGSDVFFPSWTSGNVTVAPSGATFLSGAQWEAWNGRLAVACLDGSPDVGQRLLILELNAAGTSTVSVVHTLVNRVRLRTAVQGPDGNLYVVTDADRIWKVVPS